MTIELATAIAVASVASQALLDLRADTMIRDEELAGLGDALSHEIIVGALRKVFPRDRILSEESAGSRELAGEASRSWIVDPLDGTKEFSSRGRRDWTVQIALAVAGEARLGVVTLPAYGVTLQSGSSGRCAPRRPGPLRLAVSRTRRPPVADELSEALQAELVPMGSVGAKVAAVIFGDADLYVHAGGQYQWDSAAPVAVARAAGLVATRLDGSPLRYGGPDPYLPDLLVGRPRAMRAARRALAGLMVPAAVS